MIEPTTGEIDQALSFVGVLVASNVQLDFIAAILSDDVCKFEQARGQHCGAPMTKCIGVSHAYGAVAAAFCRYHADLIVRVLGIVRARKLQSMIDWTTFSIGASSWPRDVEVVIA